MRERVFLREVTSRTSVEHQAEIVRRRKSNVIRARPAGKGERVERFLYVPLPMFLATDDGGCFVEGEIMW